MTTFDDESYRAQMYRTMTQALTERGHERDAIDLDRFRARETTH